MGIDNAIAQLDMIVEDDKKYLEGMRQAVTDILFVGCDDVSSTVDFINGALEQSGKTYRELADSDHPDKYFADGYFTLFCVAKKEILKARDQRLLPDVALANVSVAIADELANEEQLAAHYQSAVFDIQESLLRDKQTAEEFIEDFQTIQKEIGLWQKRYDGSEPEAEQEKSVLHHVATIAISSLRQEDVGF